jgi:NTP pyrophosphatase (non-canonical NTP hydrolase)
MIKKVKTISEAQKIVKDFALMNAWNDFPNIDKFDHIHEELVEMSKHLRYKSKKEMIKYIDSNRDVFEDGIGDTLFALCRLSNQLGIDMTHSFNLVHERIINKYRGKKKESKA